MYRSTSAASCAGSSGTFSVMYSIAREQLRVQTPSLALCRDDPEPLQCGQAGPAEHPLELQVVAGDRLVVGGGFQVPAGARADVVDVEPVRPGSPPVGRGR